MAGLGARGSFDCGYTSLADIAVEMTVVAGGAPLLSGAVLLPLSAAALRRVVLHAARAGRGVADQVGAERRGAGLAQGIASPVTQLWRSALLLAMTQEKKSRQAGAADEAGPPSADDMDRWRRRYRAAVRRLREAGVATHRRRGAGADELRALRSQWQHHADAGDAAHVLLRRGDRPDGVTIRSRATSARRSPSVATSSEASSAFDPKQR